MINRLEAVDCVFGYRQRRANKSVLTAERLIFESGDFCVLYGRNGAGKSTVLRTLAALQLPLSGAVLWNGEDRRCFSPARSAFVSAVVLTGFPSMGLFTAFETAALGRAPYTGRCGRLSAADVETVNTALKAADALTLKDRVFDSLSDGEKQKVMTARALAQETPLLLLDEPTSFLDYGSKRSFFRLLADCARQRGKIVIVSSHDLIYAAEENPRWIFCVGLGGEIEEKTPAFRSALFSDKN